ncbi:MAG: PrsW family intramembrane metalloprotease [Nitriliruptorales bacterium]|nr:PrsW family intramembrane metalloprotease [Nitriliruptorales bacterium]
MGSLLVSMRVEAEPGLDRLAGRWRAWIAEHSRWVRRGTGMGRLGGWLALALALAAILVFSLAARDLLAQMLWSLYLVWQFFILARSKSVTWRTCGAFFVAGALIAAPLAVLSALLLHVVFGGSPGDTWSAVGWAAISEESLKLLPLVAFLVGTRRARSLGLADHALLGAATGAGFQFTEEATRRLVMVAGGTVPGDVTAHWTVLTLFPGSFVDARAGRVLAGHAVLTALVALGIGLARRYRRPERNGIWVVPALLLVLTVIDHAAYNGRESLPTWLLRGHDALGAGFVAAPLLLMLLLAAVAIDYRGLNRLGDRVPRLLAERRVEPLREARLLLAVAPAGLPGVSSLLAFLQERRQVGYALLRDRNQPERDPVEVPIRLAWHRQRLGALLAGGAGVLLAVPGPRLTVAAVDGGAVDGGAVANLLSILVAHWGNLGLHEQIGILGALPTLMVFALGRWTAGLRDASDTMPPVGVSAPAPAPPASPADLPPWDDPVLASGSAARGRSWPGVVRAPLRVGRWMLERTPGAVLAQGLARALDAALRRVPADELSRRLADDTFPRRPARIDVNPLFRGWIDRRGRVLGLHHRGSIGSHMTARLVPGTQTAPDVNGVYQGTVTLRDPDSGEWMHSSVPSSFFPDHWSRAQVLREIRGALEVARFEGLRWEGMSPSGVRVKGQLDGDGTVRTAYPVWEGRFS